MISLEELDSPDQSQLVQHQSHSDQQLTTLETVLWVFGVLISIAVQ